MTVTIDTNVLLFLLNDKTPAPIDPQTGIITSQCADRVNNLIKSLAKTKEQIIIPTPALAEALVCAEEAAPAYLGIIEKQKALRVADFNQLAAIEAACLLADVYKAGEKPSGGAARSKFKFDIMIFAIAKLNGSRAIYSNDKDIIKLGKKYSMNVIGLADMPLPPVSAQMNIFD